DGPAVPGNPALRHPAAGGTAGGPAAHQLDDRDHQNDPARRLRRVSRDPVAGVKRAVVARQPLAAHLRRHPVPGNLRAAGHADALARAALRLEGVMDLFLQNFFNLDALREGWPLLAQGLWMTAKLVAVAVPLSVAGGLVVAV